MSKVGFCGVCDFTQSYHPSNMLLMADRPDIDWENEPDVYAGQIWFCQGCGSGTKYEIEEDEWKGY
jgi:hypothetical protein